MNAMEALMPTHAAISQVATRIRIPVENLAEALTMPDALGELQERIVVFQRLRFPGQPLRAKLVHLSQEVHELQSNPADATEWADVLILLLGSAHENGIAAAELIALAHAKMDVNETRRWAAPDADGVCHHI